MHAIKGAWVGQTFALAKFNESGGRKSRIRRSKEERKAMVETFIKKYQKSNNGNFPSLNLTHKEVGGSFYTVRELVREVIQDNRVLGPAKLTPEGQNADELFEQYPLGSLSIDPQIVFPLASSETHSIPNHHQGTGEQVLVSDGNCLGSDHHGYDAVPIINGSQVDLKIEESMDGSCIELQVGEPSEAKKKDEEELGAYTAKTTPITADVIVETFPLRSITKPTENLDGRSGEVGDLTATLEEKEIEVVGLGPHDSSSVNSSENSGLLDEKDVGNLADLLPETGSNSGLVDEKAAEKISDPLVEANGSAFNEGNISSTEGHKDLELSHNDVLTSKTSEQGQAVAEVNVINAPNRIHTNKLNDTSISSTCEESKFQEVVAVKNKVDVQGDGSSQKTGNPTLDRINLESWEGPSKNSKEPEKSNSLLAIFKAFVAAFVKFWSE